MTTTALIVAAGSGQRAGLDVPKQYTQLGSKTLLRHTLERFSAHQHIDNILVVIGKQQHALYENSIEGLEAKISSCTGSETRQGSVYAGLKHLAASPPDRVLIHDAARPFVSPGLIDRVLKALATNNAALPVVALTDTIKRVKDGSILETMDRTMIFGSQTPQGFTFDKILAAHKQADEDDSMGFTDDASIAEWAKIEVTAVAGEPQNYKITTPEDIERAMMTLCPPTPDIRCGDGFDVHRFGPGDHLTLCGITIPFEKTLVGHSDADVALHALTDALLGAIACGDIGSHFPPSDPQWRGQSSDVFLLHACKLVQEKNGRILNMDLTIICEQPKIGPLREKMRQRISEITDTELSRISVKATTTEGLGFTGRQEGIAARASVSVFLS